MYKASIDLFKIGKSMKIKFGLIIHGDNGDKINRLINKFNYMGNDYFKVSPTPFITLDISDNSTKTEGWCSNNMVNLNRYGLYRFVSNLKRLVYDMNSPANQGLYFISNGHKIVNKNIVNLCRKTFRVSNDKVISMEPCVVVDENVEYDGCILYINSYSYYTYLTLEEMEYLLNELDKIDLDSLSLNLIQLLKIHDFDLSSLEKNNNVTENKQPEETEQFVPIIDQKLPDI